MKIESIAAICHEANRRYCSEIGDMSQKSWEDTTWATRQSAIAGVIFVMQNPTAAPSKAHDNWVKQKIQDGWKYGPEKDETTKTHPCVRPYELLPDNQKIKDALFCSIVRSLTQGVSHVE